MRAAKRKWSKRTNAFFLRRRKEGDNAAYDWLKRFDPEKVRKHVFGEA